MEYVGRNIRVMRKKNGLTLDKLAQKLAISPITLHRIETGKSSPSVVLLSEIAQNLREPIVSFFQEPDRPFVHIRNKDIQSISNATMKVRLIGPRKLINDNIVVTYVELEKGKTIDSHTNPGVEWAHYLKGKSEFKLGESMILLEAGDSISYNATIEHSTTALEKTAFLGIYVETKK